MFNEAENQLRATHSWIRSYWQLIVYAHQLWHNGYVVCCRWDNVTLWPECLFFLLLLLPPQCKMSFTYRVLISCHPILHSFKGDICKIYSWKTIAGSLDCLSSHQVKNQTSTPFVRCLFNLNSLTSFVKWVINGKICHFQAAERLHRKFSCH